MYHSDNSSSELQHLGSVNNCYFTLFSNLPYSNLDIFSTFIGLGVRSMSTPDFLDINDRYILLFNRLLSGKS